MARLYTNSRTILFLALPIGMLLIAGVSLGLRGKSLPPDPGAAKAVVCLACHGADGNTKDPETPKLANQNRAYLIDAMKAYSDGRRNHELMGAFVAGLSEEDLVEIATFYASRPPR
jgi:cytochrome c553